MLTHRPPEPAPSLDEHLDLADRVSGDLSAVDDVARELGMLGGRAPGELDLGKRRRINANKDTIEKDLARLVLALVDLVRQLMERQAVRRVNAGSLSEDEVEQMGETFLKLDDRLAELKAAFGLQGEDLDLSLGTIRELL